LRVKLEQGFQLRFQYGEHSGHTHVARQGVDGDSSKQYKVRKEWSLACNHNRKEEVSSNTYYV